MTIKRIGNETEEKILEGNEEERVLNRVCCLMRR